MVLAAVAVAVLLLLIAERETLRVLFYSVYDPAVELHVDGWEGGTAHMNVRYSDVSESDYLNLYVPDGGAPAPLIVVVHGGGFVANDCESRQAQLFYQYFRDHGYACATVNYRLAQEAAFPAAVEDVKCAVRYLRANADVYGYDADRIAIWGESAGGYLAVMAGVTTDEEFNALPFIGEEELDGPVSAEIAVILDYYGAMALEPQADRIAEFRALGIHIPAFAYTLANNWMMDVLRDYPEYETVEDLWLRTRLDELSEEERQFCLPGYYIRKNLGPESDKRVLIWHGDADITVPSSQSSSLCELMRDVIGEEKVEFSYIHNAKHGAERMYTDERLGELKEYLDGALEG